MLCIVILGWQACFICGHMTISDLAEHSRVKTLLTWFRRKSSVRILWNLVELIDASLNATVECQFRFFRLGCTCLFLRRRTSAISCNCETRQSEVLRKREAAYAIKVKCCDNSDLWDQHYLLIRYQFGTHLFGGFVLVTLVYWSLGANQCQRYCG